MESLVVVVVLLSQFLHVSVYSTFRVGAHTDLPSGLIPDVRLSFLCSMSLNLLVTVTD